MIRLALLLMALLTGCGRLDRDNPLDPHSPRFVDLDQLLIGSWGRNDQERNEVYFFKDDGAVQLLDFTCHQTGPSDPVDRTATPPCHTLFGNYFLDGDQLRLSFTEVHTLPGQDPVSLPRTDKLAQISIRRETLTMVEENGTRSYTRL
jgi:hypothetical protein